MSAISIVDKKSIDKQAIKEAVAYASDQMQNDIDAKRKACPKDCKHISVNDISVCFGCSSRYESNNAYAPLESEIRKRILEYTQEIDSTSEADLSIVCKEAARNELVSLIKFMGKGG